jgi:hypothetical protein
MLKEEDLAVSEEAGGGGKVNFHFALSVMPEVLNRSSILAL